MTTAHQSDHQHVLELDTALDFINTLDLDDGQLVEHFQGPADAAAWFIDRDLSHPTATRPWTVADLEHVRHVRAALREVVEAVITDRRPEQGAVRVVNETLEARAPARLELDGRAIRVGHRHAPSPVDDALARVADTITAELATGRPDRFRICANDQCRWAFFDSSPTGRRRWCDMQTCGNRAKAARHRAKLKLTSA
ncbi:MAG: CGNR zinc finger domain-containing protein [Chloroflexota bacterium]